ncbi:DUF2235 domain-containing protein [Maritimibacter alexandrii]|uniref:DUF2235 domain-containing protein n=1 Tax=Maritimibacter alexandrii TaxID=2570355 RepID=UPI0011097237|nr:DUF2235 domain-containing protein [Maritimibacter alexandrii]
MSLKTRLNRALHGLTDGGFTRFRKWLRGRVLSASADTPAREPVTHVIVLDGTMSSLDPGEETNAGLVYRLMDEVRRSGHGAKISVYYEAGIQWRGWKSAWTVATGKGINRQIRRAYGVLASRYRPGDKIYLFGYSRGAFAVRSLSGLIGRVGLLKAEHATERNVLQAYRHYEAEEISDASRAFSQAYCHESTTIEMIGVWDTVKALGLTWPLIWRLYENKHKFHDANLDRHVLHGYHALARDETRSAYEPLIWETTGEYPGRVEQVWFPGSHGDVGGQIGTFKAARPRSFVSLHWMLGRAEAVGLTLPEGWRARFPPNPDAPSMGTFHGWGKIFVLRAKRKRGRDPSERDWDPEMPDPIDPITPEATQSA